MKKKSENGGFTLVEVIVVLVILAILAAIMIPSMTKWIDRAREKEAYVDLHTIALAAESAYTELYAEYKLGDSTQIVYSPSTPSAQAHDKRFTALMENYLDGSGIDKTRIQSVWIIGDKLYITYKYSGKTFTYQKVDGVVTIQTV